MQYRRFGKLDWQPSALGFGCMRLPTTGTPADIDEPEAMRMVHHAIEQGVNYVDTAYPYHGGNSESFLGRALKAGNYREKVRIASKLPCWLVETASDFDKYLNEQLSKIQIEHIDFYLLHALNKSSWEKMSALGIVSMAEKAVADGRIGHLGFSFHDSYEVFQEIVDAYDKWTFCQIQYNYMDIENQAGTRGLQYAAGKGLAIVIMEPLLGGRLVDPPERIQQLWNLAETTRSAPDWALQWLWNQPEVSVVLSGMSTMEQVEGNLASATASGVGTLSRKDLQVIDQVREMYQSLCPIPCTQCGYCMPCPNGVNIPRNFDVYNDGSIYDKPDWARNQYQQWIPVAERADQCIACQDCEQKCPQAIRISEWMPVVDNVLGAGRPYVSSL
ncbi:MAG: aldo/keto reductase [Anaerolineae bacterium]|nr:aldo/keto reductase [Anaerolineae bacterium]